LSAVIALALLTVALTVAVPVLALSGNTFGAPTENIAPPRLPD
jgi:hypothetical protein